MVKKLRSRIKEYFSTELLLELEEIRLAHGIDNTEKVAEVIDTLHKYDIPYAPLGKGTNRYGIILDGYAFKIALDRAGCIDNQREFKYGRLLYPSVVKVYECLDGGLLAAFEYVETFNLDMFYAKQSEMREILGELSERFLIGDIGITTVNYANWGSRRDGSICILDFAYIYSLSYKGFRCTCDAGSLLEFDRDYVNLVCPICRKKFSFDTIRRRITKEDEINEIGDIKEIGYILSSKEEEHELDPEKSEYLEKKKKNKKKKRCLPEDDELEDYNDFERQIQYSTSEIDDMLREVSMVE